LVVKVAVGEGMVVEMGHQYRQRIQVTARAGRPQRFIWREVEYHVAEILNPWRLSTRWWESAAYSSSSPGASDRHYYRVRCQDGMICEVYHDVAQQVWMLDRVYD
jgi:hypothetical protein